MNGEITLQKKNLTYTLFGLHDIKSSIRSGNQCWFIGMENNTTTLTHGRLFPNRVPISTNISIHSGLLLSIPPSLPNWRPVFH